MPKDMKENGSISGRPYRSHAHPACLPCRKRKSRCRTRDSSATCMMCLAHATECLFPSANQPVPKKRTVNLQQNAPKTAQHIERPSTPQVVLPSPKTSQRSDTPQLGRHHHAAHLHTAYSDGKLASLMDVVGDTGDDSSHVVSPVVADDSSILEGYLFTVPDNRSPGLMHTSLKPCRLMRQVLFNTIPRRPLGVYSSQSLPSMKCELIEKYLEPATKDVVGLFFEYANICFPVFDEASFMNACCTRKAEISPALLCNLYANSLIYWNNTPQLRLTRTPDIRYIWNQANEALHSELFLCPGISTILAMLLNVCGRPSTSIFGNGGMVGTAVALSNALGLNRDPSQWNISALEKGFRIRIWWLVVIHDRWCSLAYGTPLQVHRAQYDVPFPTMDYLLPSLETSSHEAAASIFIAFTTLTEVLGQYLEYIYHVSSPVRKTMTSLSHLLTNWEDSLDTQTRHIIRRGTNLTTPGAANLRLAYLSVKLLLRRIALDLDDEQTETSDIDNRNDSTSSSVSFTQVERVAEEIVHLVRELDEHQLRGFWIPAQAYSLTSATTFLLRSGLCRVKSHSLDSGNNPPLELAKEMIATLQSHRQMFGWDLGDDCLSKCGELVERIASLDNAGTGLPLDEEASDSLQPFDIDTSILDDLFWDMPYMGNTFTL
ncbi:uncharacterized protein BO88DRAFT_443804 [Aspergillus vadensis CBS 113365]|uniref:Zn(2)-C6 fungal-type domain-containing protein n=1 Tax=Aspergillus vadensis (strain CBS 113365 / IMI 142717 / IBT 24658) TaxID=1448311 RepID=A0A319B8F0_ASPVC|nr:hypothetical protein BO88DRAFT_443804 [Aspergillus vadensis CBS 113365]PYH69156.1 hypothetical protein BO88DRAFT_443804 [Aspergillus vadensis CBS 113365]